MKWIALYLLIESNDPPILPLLLLKGFKTRDIDCSLFLIASSFYPDPAFDASHAMKGIVIPVYSIDFHVLCK